MNLHSKPTTGRIITATSNTITIPAPSAPPTPVRSNDGNITGRIYDCGDWQVITIDEHQPPPSPPADTP